MNPENTEKVSPADLLNTIRRYVHSCRSGLDWVPNPGDDVIDYKTSFEDVLSRGVPLGNYLQFHDGFTAQLESRDGKVIFTLEMPMAKYLELRGPDIPFRVRRGEIRQDYWFPKDGSGITQIFRRFHPPTPEEAHNWALHPYDPQERARLKAEGRMRDYDPVLDAPETVPTD